MDDESGGSALFRQAVFRQALFRQLHFSTHAHDVPAFTSPAFSTLEIWSRVFQSCLFHPCDLVPRFPVLTFQSRVFSPPFIMYVYACMCLTTSLEPCAAPDAPPPPKFLVSAGANRRRG